MAAKTGKALDFAVPEKDKFNKVDVEICKHVNSSYSSRHRNHKNISSSTMLCKNVVVHSRVCGQKCR